MSIMIIINILKIDWTQNRNIRPICLPETSAQTYNQWMSKVTGTSKG